MISLIKCEVFNNWIFHSHPSKSNRIPSQSQKTRGFCVADFATLSDKRRSRSKVGILLNTGKRTLRSKICRAHTFENSWDFAN